MTSWWLDHPTCSIPIPRGWPRFRRPGGRLAKKGGGVQVLLTPAVLARGHGVFNVVGGLWPLLHMRSFEAVLGPKTDRWLVRTVAGLMLTNGCCQLLASSDAGELRQTRRIGMGTAATLGSIDLIYGSTGRISRLYLVDAVLEAGWIALWSRAGRDDQSGPPRFRRSNEHDDGPTT